ncbi:hypothetical protein [Buttiauxella sp. B2]|uniref:hypothetical protein n=1 Tax=Buttiauxella sp. B2 TaxID=2587812 RepID=UPI00167B43B6|nr:hypothetical protein [Buttiauxella sp. B2]
MDGEAVSGLLNVKITVEVMICVSYEWDFDIESPFTGTDLSTPVSCIIAHK